MAKRDPRQLEMYDADTHFVMLLSSMFSDCHVKDIKAGPFTLLTCLRCAATYYNGVASIGFREISRQTGFHRNTISKYVAELEKAGWIKVEQTYQRERFSYTLLDKISFYENDGRKRREKEPVGEIVSAYSPRTIGKSLERVKQFMVDGNEEHLQGSPVVINFHVTVVNNNAIGEGSTAVAQVNVGTNANPLQEAQAFIAAREKAYAKENIERGNLDASNKKWLLSMLEQENVQVHIPED